jgi:prolyl 4-hydroxylase
MTNILTEAYSLSAAGRHAEAVMLVNEGVARGDPGALFTLADWCLRGEGVPQDLAQARDLFRRAGEAGLATAGMFYTNLLAMGVGGPADWPGALARLRVEANRDPRRARALDLIQRMALSGHGDPVSRPSGNLLSNAPYVMLFPQILSEEECDYLVAVAEPGFLPSRVINPATGEEYLDPVRTSEGSTVHWLITDPALHAIERRLAAASGTRVEQGEPLQILRYAPGQQYRPHLDFIPGRSNQRLTTGLVYLNEDYEGGETCFVRTGLKVRGHKGDAVFFRNLLADGRADHLAEHAGLPVTRGAKLLASRWICVGPYVSGPNQ